MRTHLDRRLQRCIPALVAGLCRTSSTVVAPADPWLAAAARYYRAPLPSHPSLATRRPAPSSLELHMLFPTLAHECLVELELLLGKC